MGIITTMMIAEMTVKMTMVASMEEASAAVVDSNNAIGDGKASGGKTIINKYEGEVGDGNRMIKRQ